MTGKLICWLHHVSQRSTLKIQPKWYTALELENEIRPISDDTQLDFEESFAHSAEVEQDEELAELAKTWKAPAPEAEGIERNSEYTYDFDRHAFQFSKTKTKTKGIALPELPVKVYLHCAGKGDHPIAEFADCDMHEYMEVTVGEYRNFQEKKIEQRSWRQC